MASGSGGLEFPDGIEFGPGNNLFVASNSNLVLEYNGSTGAYRRLRQREPEQPGGLAFTGLSAAPEPGTLLMLGCGLRCAWRSQTPVMIPASR